MAPQKLDDRFWSDIVRTEIRRSLKDPRILCILPLFRTRTKSPAHLIKKILNGFLPKAGALPGRHPRVVSTDARQEQAEAYLYACLAAPFFCYVSPAIYGLPTCDDQAVQQSISSAGDDI
ncbi:hypothetical protein ACFVTJ_23605 [Agrobacterium sp. NPDC058088]|uniref:hypothetical protein n=1 Tax=Agrobacterium sp. NPDC058088 TaxID=3346335 RepID=UPI0036D92AEF